MDKPHSYKDCRFHHISIWNTKASSDMIIRDLWIKYSDNYGPKQHDENLFMVMERI